MAEAFTEFVNNEGRKNRTAELLSAYLHDCLRDADHAHHSEDSLDKLFADVIDLLHYVVDRDIFREHYRMQLSKRLLMSNELNEAAEQSFLVKLKAAFGLADTHAMEGMMKDYAVATDMQADFVRYASTSPANALKIPLSVRVLAQAFWPSYLAPEVTLPPVLAECLDVFRRYYCECKSNRVIVWIHSHSTATVQIQFTGRLVECSMSLYQALVLLCFTTQAALTQRYAPLPPKPSSRPYPLQFRARLPLHVSAP
eukprot:GAFH01000953.1.p2 GENE.GAFH01000953.1~~GAFH01000953.1.p2  ORF type:complete len:255 (+),score=61.48 GAFH01000953.1:956-1720(+)